MKQVLAVLGSPRKGGNTETLLKEVGRGVQYAGGAFKMTGLAELAICECDGCHVCWSGKPCAKKDAMNDLYPEIAAADAVVFGTPVYWYGPTALMKAFVDRFVYFNGPSNRDQIRGKLAATVIPFEDTSLETGALTAQFFQHSLAYLEMVLVEQMLVPGVTRRGEVRERADSLRAAEALGRKLVNGGTAE